MSWAAVAVGVASTAVGSLLGGKSRKATYTPNPTWLALQENIMKDVQKGLAAGGYTWDDATNVMLKRSAVESAATPYKGAQERVVSSLAPYGAVGAMGRGLSSMNTARAMDESKAIRDIDVARAQQKLNSQSQLMGLGAGIQDPNLPQMQMGMLNAQRPTSSQVLGNALMTGVGTGMNLYQANQNNNFWKDYLSQTSPMGLRQTTSATPASGLYGRYLNTPGYASI